MGKQLLTPTCTIVWSHKDTYIHHAYIQIVLTSAYIQVMLILGSYLHSGMLRCLHSGHALTFQVMLTFRSHLQVQGERLGWDGACASTEHLAAVREGTVHTQTRSKKHYTLYTLKFPMKGSPPSLQSHISNLFVHEFMKKHCLHCNTELLHLP